MLVDRDGYEVYDLKGKKTDEFKVGKQTSTADLIGADSMTDAHFANFIAGIRKGEKLNAPVSVGNVAVTMLQLSNIAWFVHRDLDLDPADGKDQERLRSHEVLEPRIRERMGAAHMNAPGAHAVDLFGDFARHTAYEEFKQMKTISRRTFVRSSALLAAASTLPIRNPHSPSSPRPVARLRRSGWASPAIRSATSTRAQMITWMKQLNITGLNAKDTKDHLPMDPTAEAQAVSDYEANGIHLHAVGAIYFQKDDDDDIRAKFEYCKRAGVKVIVAGDPAPATLPRVEKFVKEYDIKIAIHNHGPEDKIFPSPLDVLKFVKSMDPRMGCCIDVGHCVRAGTDVVEAIHAAGPRLFNMHIKDLTSFTSKESQVAVGEGKMPIRQIFRGSHQDQIPRLGRSGVRDTWRRSDARRDGELRLHAWSAVRHGLQPSRLERKILSVICRTNRSKGVRADVSTPVTTESCKFLASRKTIAHHCGRGIILN